MQVPVKKINHANIAFKHTELKQRISTLIRIVGGNRALEIEEKKREIASLQHLSRNLPTDATEIRNLKQHLQNYKAMCRTGNGIERFSPLLEG